MGSKITKNLKFLKLLDTAREDFKDELERSVPPEIKKTIEGGNNPIKAGKQPKYSQSYIDQIEGKAKFFTMPNGAVRRIEPKMTEGEQTSVKFTKSGVKQGKTKKAKYEKFEKGLGVGKKKSPVNLVLKGDMINSMKAYQTVKGLMVYFTDKKAEWHNDGVKENNLPARRLLPTNPGEDFNRNIKNRIIESLKKAVKKNI